MTTESVSALHRRGWGFNTRWVASALMLALTTSTGCTSVLSPISGVPANRVPVQFLATPRANWQPISLARLRQEPPQQYLLDKGDILGIYIEGVLGNSEEPPPVHIPTEDSELPPAIGFPMPVREDGTLSLPLISPIYVRGLTLGEAESQIRKAYTTDREILKPGSDRIIVTLLKERTTSVIVVRQDGKQPNISIGGSSKGIISGSTQSGSGDIVQLPAYKNDVLHALAETGGLPGLDAKNEVKILRSKNFDPRKRDEFVQSFYAGCFQDPCFCPPPLPEDPSITRIPLRLPPGQIPRFKPEDIILEEGDIVYIESRETEFFFTGGLLPGGQFPLPRDYDLDIIGAMAIAGQGIGGGGMNGGGRSGGGGGGGGGGGLLGSSFVGAPPTQLYLLRQTPCNGQIIIAVDISRAIEDPAQRLLMMPGDTLILRHKCSEELVNFGLITFFTFGIAELIRR